MTDPIELVPHPFTPLADAEGAPRRKFVPYLPVLNACSVCEARCCRLHVKASLPDAVHWCATLDLPLFAAMHFAPSEDPEHAFEVVPEAGQARDDVPWTGRAELELRRREDGACTALVEIGEHARCGVYAARPAFCRTYPMSWRDAKTKGGPAVVRCPVPYGVTPDHEAELTEDIRRAVRLWGAHDEIVTAWHAEQTDDRSTAAFLAFAWPRAAEVVGVSAEVAARALDPRPLPVRVHQAMVDGRVIPAPRR